MTGTRDRWMPAATTSRRTTPDLTTRPRRLRLFPDPVLRAFQGVVNRLLGAGGPVKSPQPAAILTEMRTHLAALGAAAVDWIIFVAAGESYVVGTGLRYPRESATLSHTSGR